MPDHIDELKKLQNLRNVSNENPLEFEDLFDLVESGCNGEINIRARGIAERLNDENYSGISTLPNELPPIISSDHKLDLEEYLIHPERLPIHDFHHSQRFWSRKPKPELLYHTNYSPVLTTLKVERDFKSGKLLGYKEVDVLHADQTGKNSTSLQRQPDSYDSEITGNSTNIPFRPGGLESIVKDEREEITLDFESDLLSVPPGFAQKISFNSEDEHDGKFVINIPDILSGNDVELNDAVVDREKAKEDKKVEKIKYNVDENPDKLERSDSLEKLIVDSEINSDEVVSEANNEPDNVKTWAVMVNIEDPVKDFHKIIPDMAKQYPFELDTFQKQAIIQLENKECVFVAAHTSAGKTVVAEYAIALASKHMTKTIYTSPIKALSNQKFRDFKDTFESVGLITGDVQINPEASCLVMTTEILRSMLYRGSRVIRDTEWVIFDEIHYVNDVERGVVWEEVLIMLPDHVNIIMLSATVPNTREFAEWVGRIKKKKMHVISTSKRPVPLEYFLYTGNSKKTSGEFFQIVDTFGKFQEIGYKKAVDAKNQRKKKSKEATGPKGPRFNVSPSEDRNIWISLIHKLEETDPTGLPVVAFTFSRTRCNDNANRLSSLDLTTKKEKNQIKTFIRKCVSKLKDEDAKLPQVKQMEELLNRGLAVHHSGILPILKEMIEMLFQEGLVKLLFATETFAMGVNMPAKTVVFDSVRKHDGSKFRDLLPGEFIQMAGRAGRRGKDKSGTVIILCKGDVPELSDLKKMMMGKPTLLESRFRVTYSMILNLHRSSEDLSVEEMMKRSFAEFHLLKKAPERELLIKETESELKNIDILSCQKCQRDIANYYKDCKSIQNLRNEIQAAVVSSTNGQKALSPGRIVVLKNKQLEAIYGIILNKKQPYSTTDKDVTRSKKSYDVLVLCDKQLEDAKFDLNETLKPFAREMMIFCPDRPCQHKIMNVIENDIALITDRMININSEAVIGDYKNRQLPRFRENAPGKSTILAMEELLRISESNPHGLPQESLPLKDLGIQESITQLSLMESRMDYYECVGCLCFQEHFKRYHDERILRDRIKNLKEKSSLEMLSLNPQYKTRKQVLYELGYLENERKMVRDKPHDNQENVVVSMKGLVACEISSHEIVISWLLLNKFFDNYEPEEIVALLSCFVFQQKRCSEPTLTEKLEKGKKIIEDTGKQLYRMEQKNKTCSTVDEYEEFQEYRFGLVQAVHEWAKGMPFYEITQLTDVQEGIIVRCIQRLNELCQDVKNAAKKLGVVELQTKMESASNLLKRDIVFAASLYIQ